MKHQISCQEIRIVDQLSESIAKLQQDYSSVSERVLVMLGQIATSQTRLEAQSTQDRISTQQHIVQLGRDHEKGLDNIKTAVIREASEIKQRADHGHRATQQRVVQLGGENKSQFTTIQRDFSNFRTTMEHVNYTAMEDWQNTRKYRWDWKQKSTETRRDLSAIKAALDALTKLMEDRESSGPISKNDDFTWSFSFMNTIHMSMALTTHQGENGGTRQDLRVSVSSAKDGAVQRQALFLVAILGLYCGYVREGIYLMLSVLPTHGIRHYVGRSLSSSSSDAIKMIDAFGQEESLSISQFQHWQVLESWLRVKFVEREDGPGLDRVVRGEFGIFEDKNPQNIITASTWKNSVTPRGKYRVAMVLSQLQLHGATCIKCNGDMVVLNDTNIRKPKNVAHLPCQESLQCTSCGLLCSFIKKQIEKPLLHTLWRPERLPYNAPFIAKRVTLYKREIYTLRETFSEMLITDEADLDLEDLSRKRMQHFPFHSDRTQQRDGVQSLLNPSTGNMMKMQTMTIVSNRLLGQIQTVARPGNKQYKSSSTMLVYAYKGTLDYMMLHLQEMKKPWLNSLNRR